MKTIENKNQPTTSVLSREAKRLLKSGKFETSRRKDRKLSSDLEKLAARELARMQAAEVSELPSAAKLATRVADELGLPTSQLDDKPWAECSELTRKIQQVRVLTPKHQEVARLRAAGVDEGVIAREVGARRKTVANWLQDPKVELLTRTLQAGRDNAASAAAERIRALQLEAVETLAELLKEDVRESVRLGAAKDLLDRGGHAAPKQVQVSSVSAQLSLEEVLSLQGRLAQEKEESQEEEEA